MKKILFLSANPVDTINLRLDDEIRDIQDVLESSKRGKNFELIFKPAASIDILRHELLVKEPEIVHFSVHGNGTDGIILEDHSGYALLVSTESLSNLFKQFKDTVECVLLNACYSETQAEAIYQHINCVIGMERAITDQAAIYFSTAFYDALNAEKSYKEAFEIGRNNIELNGIPESFIPKIKIKNDFKSPSNKDLILVELEKDIFQHIPRRYRVLEKISESIKGSVYKARDNYLERNIAIKVFHNNGDLESEGGKLSKENFKNSVINAVSISIKPNFINIYDVCFKSKYYYYTMEFIDGCTIRQHIDQKHLFTYEDICLIICKIGNALIHSGNLEFNIKPSNIMLVFKSKDDKNNEYEPFISPLNLSEKQSQENIVNYLTELKEQQQEKKYREELAYLIPEQFKFCSEKVERPTFKQSAQYSLGLLAYELFTYEIPTTIQDHKDLINQEFQKLTPFRQKCSNCSQIIEKIILKMVLPEPEERYKNIQNALDLIHRHIDFNINTAKESYKRCAFERNFDNTFFDSFYGKFIDKCPEAEEKFSTFEEKEKEKKKEYWNRQHQLLKQAVLVLFAYFEEKDQLDSSDYYEQEEPNILSRIAEIHDRHHKNIPISMYTAFVDALVETIIDFDPWCKKSQENDNKHRIIIVKDAWEKVLKPGVEYMKTKY